MNHILFFSIFFSLYAGLHYYFIVTIKKSFNLTGTKLFILKFLVIFEACSFVLLEILEKKINTEILIFKYFAKINMIWLGIVCISITVFVLFDIIKLFIKCEKNKYLLNKISFLLIILISVFSIINGSRNPRIKEIKINIPTLNTEKFTIVQLSDLHITTTTNVKEINYIIQKVNEISPDLIVITGDLFDTVDEKISNKLNFISQYGVYFVKGNHEYYIGENNSKKFLENSNIKLLDNQSLNIDNKIILAGVDEKFNSFNSKKAKNILDKIFSFPLNSLPIVLLSHKPQVFDIAEKYGVKLVLAGHTHAGQIPPFDVIEFFFFKYMNGLYKKNNSFLYVTPGTRYWGAPMRLFSRSEIVKIILYK